MVPKKIESSNNVDLSCVNVESAEPFQLDIRKVTNQTDSSGDPNKPRENAGTPETSIDDDLRDFCCEEHLPPTMGPRILRERQKTLNSLWIPN
jgi:hypothetical protein